MSTEYQLTNVPYSGTLCSGTCGQNIERHSRAYVRAHRAWHPGCVPITDDTTLLAFRPFEDKRTQELLARPFA